MPVIGLTGGIASGKSTVASLFQAKGATVLDADVIARELVAPGASALEEIRRRFGDALIAPNGWLDRGALGSIVFSDPQAREDLNEILHPRIFGKLREGIAQAGPDALIVVEAALLVESAPWDTGELKLDALVVIDSGVEHQVGRAVARGMSEEEVRARVEAQVSSGERKAAADFVIDNSGSPADLEEQFEMLWRQLQEKLPDTSTTMVSPGD